MNIKSLLLGSAAAFAVVTGAQAADVVVAQPEPVEYVKVCDAYGAGFFYIPGTETCLHISGYMFLQIDASKAQATHSLGIPVRASTSTPARRPSSARWASTSGSSRTTATAISGAPVPAMTAR